MSVDVGQVLERVVRRDSMGISELSRKLNVSRRTIYNWFDQKSLNPEILLKVGHVIGHDFSKELPEAFTNSSHRPHNPYHHPNQNNPTNGDSKSVYFWMDKYIKLLEKYNELLGQLSDEKKGTETSQDRSIPRDFKSSTILS
jgi:hypothetical protein